MLPACANRGGSRKRCRRRIREIREKVPDLVLLDIKMDDGTGFDLLEAFDHIGFQNHLYYSMGKIRHSGFSVSVRWIISLNP
jgi:two-component SAPR family response regulator